MSNFITTVTIRARTWVISLKQYRLYVPHAKYYQQTARNASDFDLLYNCVCMNTSSFIARSKSKLAYNSQNSCRILSIYYYFIIMPRRKQHLCTRNEWIQQCYLSDTGAMMATFNLHSLSIICLILQFSFVVVVVLCLFLRW